jgi:hypothetical protein
VPTTNPICCRDGDGGVKRGVLCALMRQAAEELGQWDTKSETAGFDPGELVRVLHEGPERFV